jgi:hypothetical protein
MNRPKVVVLILSYNGKNLLEDWVITQIKLSENKF